jgi:deoxyadenosine/deoxycytidine kinase
MRQRLVAEIIGPAGAGKSTLARVLHQRDGTIPSVLSVWGLPQLLLIVNALVLAPKCINLFRRRRWSCLYEMGLVIRLQALHQLLTRERMRSQKAFFMDEGAIYGIVKLRACNLKSRKGCCFEDWIQNALNRWAETLDAVIWLDAPDDVLAQRIRDRAKPHRVKGLTDQEIQEFLAHSRSSYEQVMIELSTRPNLKIVRFSTEQNSLEKIAKEISLEIEPKRTGHVLN